jgi:type IV secretory pathway TraG/TraD family ATPase VirD4
MNDTLLFGETTYHRHHRPFGIKQADRLAHTYVIGKTGVGKSTLLQVMAQGDLKASRGFALFDPHGDLAEAIYENAAPEERLRITYLNAPDLKQHYGYNPLRKVSAVRIPLVASGLLETFRKLWPQAWGVRMEHVLRNSLYALLEREGSTLPDILRLYTDQEYRKALVRGIKNPVVRRYWTHEFEKYQDRQRAEAVAPIQNKLGALLSDPRLYRILVAAPIDLRFRSLMDEGHVLLVNLSKGQIGEDACMLLGGVLVSALGLAALSRADNRTSRRPFHLFVDEFQTFTTLAFVSMMAELRKYGVGLTLAHQHLDQLDGELRHAVLGNAGTLIAFRMGAEDAIYFAREFQPAFGVEDLINLPNRHFYTRLMIDGEPSAPFSAATSPSREPPHQLGASAHKK